MLYLCSENKGKGADKLCSYCKADLICVFVFVYANCWLFGAMTYMLMPLIPSFQVFQKRFNGTVDFYRGFNEYENGFGSVYGEFWLGIYYIKLSSWLANRAWQENKVELTYWIALSENLTYLFLLFIEYIYSLHACLFHALK